MPKIYTEVVWYGENDYYKEVCLSIFGSDYILYKKRVRKGEVNNEKA